MSFRLLKTRIHNLSSYLTDMDQQYFQNHMAHIRIMRRHRDILAHLHQHPAPQDQVPQEELNPPVPPVSPPIVAPPPQIVVMPQPPVAQQDIQQLRKVL